jgi:hypothetical protein
LANICIDNTIITIKVPLLYIKNLDGIEVNKTLLVVEGFLSKDGKVEITALNAGKKPDSISYLLKNAADRCWEIAQTTVREILA